VNAVRDRLVPKGYLVCLYFCDPGKSTRLPRNPRFVALPGINLYPDLSERS